VSPTLTIRTAGPHDRDALLALLLAQLREHAIDTPPDEVARALDALLRRPHRGRIIVAAAGERLVGFAALSFGLPLEHGAPGAWLEELFVEPASRECGIGTRLLRAALGAAADAGAVGVDLEVEASHGRAAALYAREGFRPLTRARWLRRLTPRVAPVHPLPEAVSGGCLCGAVRYRVAAAPLEVVHCHCSLCRRATGAPFVTWATFAATAFSLTAGAPVERRSTPGAVRTHCAACGTALTFREDARPGSVDVTVGSLDDPEALPPTGHIWVSRRLSWLDLDDVLPRHAEKDPGERDA
jgi:GNAT superfamily N-acetyltransferase